MTVTAEQVRELRERTGAGLMECKKFLTENNGSIEDAFEAMRKAGQAKADKKSGRIAADGLIVTKVNAAQDCGVIIEINCETDFVARSDDFKHFAEAVAMAALTHKVQDVASLVNLSLDNQVTVEQARQALIAKIGENVQIRRVELQAAKGKLTSYVHGGRIGVLVDIAGGDEQLGKDLAMHIAANSPVVISREQVPAELIAKEKEVFSAQAQSSGKPPAIIEKMIEGRINKYLDEISLLGQPFVKNPDVTVAQLLQQANAKVAVFTRFAVGEGIEKQMTNFADEVMAQVRGN